MERGGDKEGQGRVGLKSLIYPRLALWCGAKILPHPRPITFVGWGKPVRGEVERGGLSKAGKNCHP